jgi:hypothetical protein
MFDKDRSGGLDTRELGKALQQLGMEADSKQTIAMLQRFDKDGGGTLDVYEFAELVQAILDFQAKEATTAQPSGTAATPSSTDQPRPRRGEIGEIISRPEIANAFTQHRVAIDELFGFFASEHAPAAAAALDSQQLAHLLHAFQADAV